MTELLTLTKLKIIKEVTGAKWEIVIQAAVATSLKGGIRVKTAICWINSKRIGLN